MSQGTNPTYNGEGKSALLNMIHSAPNKAELTGYKPHITGVLTSGNAADDSFLRNHLGRVYYSSLHYAGLDHLITDAVDSSFRTISMTPTGLYEGTASTAASYMVATGGTITTDGDYKVHTFNSSATFTVTTLGDIATVRYLVVAGGGAGGGTGGGGGGAGGYKTATGFSVSATAYSITVGGGGVGSSSTQGGSGGNSVFSSITSTGGGGGGGNFLSVIKR